MSCSLFAVLLSRSYSIIVIDITLYTYIYIYMCVFSATHCVSLKVVVVSLKVLRRFMMFSTFHSVSVHILLTVGSQQCL